MSVLYSPAILSLAVELADYPLDELLPLQGDAHSRVCGSTILMAVSTDENEAIDHVGMRVSACAIGQASSAIFAKSAQGKAIDQLCAALTDIDQWLSGKGEIPDWPLFEQLAPALPYSGRHEAIRLPWRAAIAALSNPRSDR